jgi:hypothetical protein
VDCVLAVASRPGRLKLVPPAALPRLVAPVEVMAARWSIRIMALSATVRNGGSSASLAPASFLPAAWLTSGKRLGRNCRARQV